MEMINPVTGRLSTLPERLADVIVRLTTGEDVWGFELELLAQNFSE